MSNSAAHCLGDTARYIYIYFSCCFGTTGNFNHRRKKPPPPCATVWPTLRARFLSLPRSLSPISLPLLPAATAHLGRCQRCLRCLRLQSMKDLWQHTQPHTHNSTHTHIHPHTHKDTRIDCGSVALPSFLCHIIIFIMTLPAAASATVSARPVIREWLVTKNDNNNNCICVCVCVGGCSCGCAASPSNTLAFSYSIEPHERWPIQDIRYDSQISTNICYYSQRAPSKDFPGKTDWSYMPTDMPGTYARWRH